MRVEKYRRPLDAFSGLFLALAIAAACTSEDDTATSAFAIANADGTIVCHNGHEIDVAFPSVAAHLAHDDFLGPCSVAAAAAASVLVCHVAGAEPNEISIAFNAVAAHLAHGDFLGPCEPLPE